MVAHRSVKRRQARRLICDSVRTRQRTRAGTYVDELESVPDVEQSPGGLFETDDGSEAEDVDADFKQLVGDMAGGSENVCGRFRDAL